MRNKLSHNETFTYDDAERALDSMRRLMEAISAGDPVVELQANFGGGKTHSMLALYHMAGPTPVQDLSGLDRLPDEHGLGVPQGINRAVLVGTSRGPQDVLNAEGGRKIRTTWGELAWQLGGAEAFDMIAENDANGIAPGSNLLEAIFKKYAPCLILIDEWVAYLRQMPRQASKRRRLDGSPVARDRRHLQLKGSPTRFTGTVMISPERPARDIHQIVEAIVEQLTSLPESKVTLKLEIEAEVPSGFERSKVRTLVENANTPGFIEKSIE